MGFSVFIRDRHYEKNNDIEKAGIVYRGVGVYHAILLVTLECFFLSLEYYPPYYKDTSMLCIYTYIYKYIYISYILKYKLIRV